MDVCLIPSAVKFPRNILSVWQELAREMTWQTTYKHASVLQRCPRHCVLLQRATTRILLSKLPTIQPHCTVSPLLLVLF